MCYRLFGLDVHIQIDELVQIAKHIQRVIVVHCQIGQYLVAESKQLALIRLYVFT